MLYAGDGKGLIRLWTKAVAHMLAIVIGEVQTTFDFKLMRLYGKSRSLKVGTQQKPWSTPLQHSFKVWSHSGAQHI